MNISVATATFYYAPFSEALELIKKSGFEYIELDTYWTGGDNWEVTQHLRNIKPREVLKIVKESGLKINSLHDMGGVVFKDTDSFISKDIYEYLEYGGGDIPCIVFHAPHKKTDDKTWWERYKRKAAEDINEFKSRYLVCIENIQNFPNYFTSLINPVELFEFVKEQGIFINIDTTHYAQCGVDLKATGSMLKEYVKSVHFSDYKDKKRHLFPGEGELDLKGFVRALNTKIMHGFTLECDIPYEQGNPELSIEWLKRAKDYVENLVRM